MRKILVTGAAGYIGSELVEQLLSRDYFVKGLDIMNFGEASIIGFYNHPHFKFLKGDIRNKSCVENAIKDMDAVVHLAAIVGDPACSKHPQIAEETNWDASKLLFDMCNESQNIKRFIFASTCSNYGKGESEGYLNEESPLRPVSLYAELKVKFEKYILTINGRKDMVPVLLRFATAYGISPRMRFDLTVNEFIKEIFLGHELIVYGEHFWRPYCHVNDLAGACILALESEEKKVANQIFGVGDTRENYQKKTLVDKISKIFTDARVRYVHKKEDPRDYRVNFSKIQNVLGFKIKKTVEDGIKEMFSALKNGLFSNPDDTTYKNV